MENNINLGKTELIVSRIGLGIMQWRDMQIDPSKDTPDPEIREIFHTALDGGINFFDTAESYGSGRSEMHLGRCLKEITPADIVIASKFMPYPWKFRKGELRSSLVNSLKRIGRDHLDLYQMHWPIPILSIRAWMEAMADAVADGLIRAVGVSNYSPGQTEQAAETLARHNIPLASNQVQYSLLHRSPERNGLVELCRKLNVTIIAYSPIEKGILTGKYTPGNKPSGYRRALYNDKYLERIMPLMEAIQAISKSHPGAGPSQVALNWLSSKGAVPIPGARNKTQAQENVNALKWQLSSQEMDTLERVSNELARERT